MTDCRFWRWLPRHEQNDFPSARLQALDVRLLITLVGLSDWFTADECTWRASEHMSVESKEKDQQAERTSGRGRPQTDPLWAQPDFQEHEWGESQFCTFCINDLTRTVTSKGNCNVVTANSSVDRNSCHFRTRKSCGSMIVKIDVCSWNDCELIRGSRR